MAKGKASGRRAAKDGAAADGAADMRGVVHCDSVRPGNRTSRVAFRGEPPVEGDPLLGFAPYIHKQLRRNSITPERQRAFIAALAASGIVTQAARVIGASLEALYKIRNMPGAEGFAAAWEEAVDRGMARLEDCALERAIEGEERFVVRDGEVVARWRRYDTPLLVFLLRNRRGRRYDAFGIGRGERALSPEEERARAIEEERKAAEVLKSINAKLERIRERWLAAQEAQRAGDAAGEDARGEDIGCGDMGSGEADAAGVSPEDGAGVTAGEAPAAEAGRSGLRLLPDLLREGDKALGVARRQAYAREAVMMMRGRMPPPLTLEEEVARRVMDDMDAGRIGPKARGEVRGVD